MTTSPDPQLRILFFSLEFEDPIFSGNGVFSRTWVRALSSHPDVSVLVVCARPRDAHPIPPGPISSHPNVRSLAVPVSLWHKLDRHGPWKEYAHGAAELFSEQIASFSAHLALAVDWTGANAMRWVKSRLQAAPPVTFLNFRVFSLSSSISAQDRRFYEAQEAQAVHEAANVIALCSYDAQVLHQADPASAAKTRVISPILRREVRNRALKLQLKQSAQMHNAIRGGSREVPVVASPLRRRHSVAQISLSPSASVDAGVLRRYHNVKYGFGGQPRKCHLDRDLAKWRALHPGRDAAAARSLLTCCCRVCPEKNVLVFVEVVERLAGFLREEGIAVCLVGPLTEEVFGRAVVKRLRRAVRDKALLRLIPRFVSHEELGSIFAATLLNFHPATYEAFGMTVVEAAAYQAPTLMDSGGKVGVRDLLPAPQSCFLCDMTNPDRAARDVRALLRPSSRFVLKAVGASAQQRAFEWNEVEFCKKVQQVVWAGVSEDQLKAPPDYAVILDATGPIAEEVWVLNSLAERFARAGKSGVDAEVVKEVVGELNKLSVYALAVELGEPRGRSGSLLRRETSGEDRALDNTETRCSVFFSKTSNTIMEARYLMVPSRVKEAVFWRRVIQAIQGRVLDRDLN